MNRIYNLNHRLVATILLLNLFLQSCNNFANQVTSQGKELTHVTSELSEQQPLVSEELMEAGSSLVSFDRGNEELQAGVRFNEQQPTTNYEELSVTIKAGTDLDKDQEKGREKEKETEKYKREEESIEELLDYAKSGNIGSQFRLGEIAYEAWQSQHQIRFLYEAEDWLGRAARPYASS